MTATAETAAPAAEGEQTEIKATVDGAEANIKLTPPAADVSAYGDSPAAAPTEMSKPAREQAAQLSLVEPGIEDLVRAYGAAADEEEKADDALASAKARLKWATSMRESVGKEIARAALRMRNPSLADVARQAAHEDATDTADEKAGKEDRYVLSGTDGTVIGGGRFMRVPQADNKELCMCGAAMDVGGDVHDTVHAGWLEGQGLPATAENEMLFPRVRKDGSPSLCVCGTLIDADVKFHQRQHGEYVASIGHELAPSSIAAPKDIASEAPAGEAVDAAAAASQGDGE